MPSEANALRTLKALIRRQRIELQSRQQQLGKARRDLEQMARERAAAQDIRQAARDYLNGQLGGGRELRLDLLIAARAHHHACQERQLHIDEQWRQCFERMREQERLVLIAEKKMEKLQELAAREQAGLAAENQRREWLELDERAVNARGSLKSRAARAAGSPA